MNFDKEKQAVVLSARELALLSSRKGHLEVGRAFIRPRVDADVYDRLLSSLGALAEPAYLTVRAVQNDVDYFVEGLADALDGEGRLWFFCREGFKPSACDEAERAALAHLYLAETGGARVSVGFLSPDGDGLKQNLKIYSADEAKAAFDALLESIAPFGEVSLDRATVRLPSASSAVFPYSSLREGQELLIRECYRDFKAGKRLFAEAPTGIGKTLSTLYPAVRAVGDGVADRVFYLTAKAAPRREAYAAAAKLFEAGARLRTLVLTAREQLCPNAAAKADPAGIPSHCNSADCPLAKGFFDRCDKAIFALLSHGNGYPRKTIVEVAHEFSICPYEFQLELLAFCDIIICDYNYVFDPFAYLRRCFGEENDGKRSILLVDEAHNLASRASDMYSASLSLSPLRAAIETLEPGSSLYEEMQALIHRMEDFREICRDTLEKDESGVERGYDLNSSPQTAFFDAVRAALEDLERFFRIHRREERAASVAPALSALRRFSTIADGYDRHYTTFLEVEGDERRIRLFCLDPSEKLSECLGKSISAVLFSATLTPLDYFADILGGQKGDATLSLACPFPPENLCIVRVPTIHTRYAERDDSYAKLASVIAGAVSGKRGNYIAYFPSYEYLEAVRQRFAKKYPSVPLVVQSRGMNTEEKEKFLSAFCEDDKLRVGFCVLGGSFSEGVDLPGKRLIGSIIVGTGLPGISSERNILMEYYDATRERGFDYAYTYPGMNRVLQAAGRVIRREEDRGILVLADDRYVSPATEQLFPAHWKEIKTAGSAKELAEIVSDFWKKC